MSRSRTVRFVPSVSSLESRVALDGAGAMTAVYPNAGVGYPPAPAINGYTPAQAYDPYAANVAPAPAPADPYGLPPAMSY